MSPPDPKSAAWRQLPIVQQPEYPDQQHLASVLGRLRELPPLVTAGEIRRLRADLIAAEQGRAFVLQGGDCAESFADCTAPIIANRLRVLLQMSLVLVHGLQQKVVRIGRFAGQYAKPRSTDLETRDGLSLPSYRGDLVNGPEFSPAARTPDPERLLEAHANSALTLNYVRALIEGGFADLHHPENWNLDWMRHASMESDYRAMLDAIGQAIRFMEMVAGRSITNLDRVEFFTSHEALLLDYEDALTRQPLLGDREYNLGCHLPWIGMWTADPGHAHVAYCAAVANPVGVKLGPGMTEAWLRDLLDALNPQREPGRLVLITRLGAGHVEQLLPAMIETVQRHGTPVLWLCDPMHGNTQSTESGIKTRAYKDIEHELHTAHEVHAALNSRLGGVHLELTGEDVTECLGGARALQERDLQRAYRSQVDPRLNYEQAMELAMGMARRMGSAAPG